MIHYFEEDVIPKLAPILNLIDGEGSKIFRNVTLEKIDRDIVDTYDARGPVKNPEWRKWSDTRLAGSHLHKNFIWDNISKENERATIIELIGIRDDVNLSTITDEEREEFATN